MNKSLFFFKFPVVLASFFSAMLFSGCESTGKHNPVGLMVDLLVNPEEAVITNPAPMFSWIMDDNRQGAEQTSYQIMVASSKAGIAGNKADKWDSGKTPSGQSVSVSYEGSSLEPFTTYWWKVRIWDQVDRPGKWSIPQVFHTGSFDRDGLKWPGESRWVETKTGDKSSSVFEDRHLIRYHEIAPVSVIKNEAGNYFIRFEKAAFGALKLKLDDPAKADTLIVHLGEKLAPGNRVDTQPGGSITYNQVKIGIEPGKTEYLVTIPRFIANWPHSQVLADHMPEVTPFRYAEIEGWSGTLSIEQVRQHALLYHFDDSASSFSSPDNKLNQIWDLCKHTLKVTPFMGVYIDGGARERMPYEADSYIQQISHYAVDREFAIQRYTANFLIFNTSRHTEWHLHVVPMAWADYMATGNSAFIKKYYNELKKKAMLELAREDGLISTRTGLVTEEFLKGIHYPRTDFEDIVDWPQGTPANEPEMRPALRYSGYTIEGETDRYVFSDINTVVNAFHYRNLVLMGNIAAVLGKTDEERFFRERAERVKASVNEKLLNHTTGLYRDGEGVEHYALHASMFPVAFGMAPDNYYPQLRSFLISKGMACSPYGAPYLFDALYELGAEDYAFSLLTSETDRSWMNMIRIGTTITSEAWDLKYKRNMTWNHAWGASPAYIITRRLFGIEALEPAYRKVLIKPRPGSLKSAEIKSPTIRGPVDVKFDNEPGETFDMEITIPANTMAKLLLPIPDVNKISVTLNGRVMPVHLEDNSILLDNLAAGSYHVQVTGREK